MEITDLPNKPKKPKMAEITKKSQPECVTFL